MTIATRDEASTIELALVEGDLSKLSASQRLEYYRQVCDSLKLNPYTKPFEYLRLNNRLVLYAGKNAADAGINFQNHAGFQKLTAKA